jgi:hypothetical protein
MQDEEINETIARRLFGMVRPDEDVGQVVYIGEWPNYCGDIAVAWPILDRLFELGWWPNITRDISTKAWVCDLKTWWGAKAAAVGAPAWAISRAAVEALKIQQPE